MNHGGFGLTEQVNQELVQHQIKNNKYGQPNFGGGKYNNKGASMGQGTQQREFEEAMELDRILEAERRQQSMEVFAQAADKKYDNYLARLEAPNIKNASRGIAGVFGMGDTGGAR